MQLVLAYDMAQWRQWQRYLRPQDCLMPHRQEDETYATASPDDEEAGPGDDDIDEGPSSAPARAKAARRSQVPSALV